MRGKEFFGRRDRELGRGQEEKGGGCGDEAELKEEGSGGVGEQVGRFKGSVGRWEL